MEDWSGKALAYYWQVDWDKAQWLFTPALLTAAIEVPIFFLCGYRRLQDCLLFVGINIISNILLNSCLSSFYYIKYYYFFLGIAESLVVLLEFALCTYLINDEHKKLFFTIILTNCSSFICGLILYGSV